MSEMEPALTPAEWSGEDRVVISTTSPKLGYFVYADSVPDGLELSVVGPQTFTLPPDSAHTLAAMCLHGQPFGFTRDDVRTLRTMAVTDHEGFARDDSPDAFLASLADRIEALLPPPKES